MILIGDTSGLVAALNTGNPEHEAARKALRTASATAVSPLVFAEVEHVVTRNLDRGAAHAVDDWLLAQERTTRLLVPEVAADTLRTARRLQTRYAGLRLDPADAANVVVAEQHETASVLTLDRRDVRAIRPPTGHQAFHLLPDGL